MKSCLICVSGERNRGTNIKSITQVCSKVCKRNIFDSRSYDDNEQEDEKFNYPGAIFGFWNWKGKIHDWKNELVFVLKKII